MFVVPKLYHQYRYLFDSILGDESRSKPSKNLPDVCRVMKEYWTMIKARNEVFCGTLEENELKTDNPTMNEKQSVPTISQPDTNGPITPGSSVNNHVHEAVYEERVVHALDSVGRHVDSITGLLLDNDTWIDIRGHTAKSAANSIFGTTRLQPQAFIKLISIMCRWATSESRYGDWKAYLVASVLLSWRDQDKSTPENKILLQDALIHFLDDEASPKSTMTNNDNMDSQLTVEEGKYVNNRIFFQLDTLKA
jgi:hypothetical protein